MVLTRDDQITKIFVNDLNCKISKSYNSVVSVPCPFPISPQAFRQTLLDMVLLTQITASLHNQRASCMKKSICYFFSPTCCSSAQVHVSRMTHMLLSSTCLMLSWVEQSLLWLQSPVFQQGWESRAAGAPGTSTRVPPPQQLLSTASCHGECSPRTLQIQSPFLRSQKCQGSIFASELADL